MTRWQDAMFCFVLFNFFYFHFLQCFFGRHILYLLASQATQEGRGVDSITSNRGRTIVEK